MPSPCSSASKASSTSSAISRALIENTELDARSIVEKSLGIAADICIYTNRQLTIETLGSGAATGG